MRISDLKKINKNLMRVILIVLGSFIVGTSVYAILITSGPNAQDIGASTAHIRWSTDVNSDSTVCYTADNTPTWAAQPNGVSGVYFSSVSALRSNKVWASGYTLGGVPNSYLLFYNGYSWQVQYPITGSKYNSIYALDDTHVWAVGDNGKIMFSNGSSWSSVTYTNVAGYNLYDIEAVNANNIFIGAGKGSDGALFICDSADGTCDQRYYKVGSGPITDISGVTWTGAEYAVWLIESGSNRICFNDPVNPPGGGSCVKSYTAGYPLYDITALDTSHVWAVGAGGNVMFYDGTGWTSKRSENPALAAVTAFYDSGLNQYHVWAAGTNAKTIYSSNGGNSWTDQTQDLINLGMTDSFLGLDAYSKTDVWLSGYSRDFYHFGLNYSVCQNNASPVGVHDILLSGLWPSTVYYYKACSEDALGKDVCSGNLTFRTKDACIDETPYGECNDQNQYCNNGTLSQPNNCKYCGVPCVFPTRYCSPTSETCVAACSDGTVGNTCSTATPGKWCDQADFTLKDDCRKNCGPGCSGATPYCNQTSGVCEDKCIDGTKFDTCNAQNQYCDNGTLTVLNNCAYCGVDCSKTPLTPYCSPISEICLAACIDGTEGNTCSTATPGKWCDSADYTLKDDCRKGCTGYSCSGGTPHCNQTTGVCEAACSDGTPKETCNKTTKQWCDSSFQLSNNCSVNNTKCGFDCPVDSHCDTGTGLCAENKCSDGTPYDGCNTVTKQYCDSGTLVYNCNKCAYSCPLSKPYCNPGGQCEEKCVDGTDKGGCSGTKWCDPADLTLKDDCRKTCGYDCGTLYCDPASGACEAKCSDGTLYGACSSVGVICGMESGGCWSQYCNSGTLKYFCGKCNYSCSAGKICNATTGDCDPDTTPPVISEINVDPGYNSAVISWIIDEPANSTVAVSSNPDCSGSVYLISNLLQYPLNHSMEVFNLGPLTQYYFCLFSADQAGNIGKAQDPPPADCSAQCFTTLAEPDTIAPTITITSPVNNATVSGVTDLKAQAQDNVGISLVTFLLYSNPASTPISLTASLLSADTYAYTLDTTSVDNGTYTLKAEAKDAAGNKASDEIIITIYNDTSPPVISNVKADPQVDAVGNHFAVITWDTDEDASSRVDYTLESSGGGYDPNYGASTEYQGPATPCLGGSCVQKSDLVRSHSLTLTGLAPNKRYHYRVSSCDSEGNCAH